MGPLEIVTIVALGIVLGVKWFTQMHTTKLAEDLVVAENEEKKYRGRYKKLEGEREAIGREIKELTIGLEKIDAEVQDLEEDLFEIDQRNSEIKDQVGGN